MHVIHVIWHLAVGGGELFLRDLAGALVRHGIRQEVFTVGPSGPVETDITALGVPVRQFRKSTKAGLATVTSMAREIRALAPDLVHAHGEAGAIWGLPAARIAGVPSVALMYINADEPAMKMRVMRTTLGWPVRVIAGSADVSRFLNMRLGVSPGRLRTVPCGINPAAFHLRDVTVSRPASVIVSVGRLVERKGHHVLIDAFKGVLSSHAAAELHVVGDGPERGALERRARAAGLGDRVRFPGTLYPTADTLAAADLFVFPSLVEPQGLALLEAYAAGVPVVASRTGGIVEMLEHDVDGLLVEPGDAAGLTSAMLRMLDDQSLRERVVLHARSRLARFDVNTIAEEYVAVYKEAAARRS